MEIDKLRPEVAEQIAHCDGNDCHCMAYGPRECACDADWTPAEVYLSRDRAEQAEAERDNWHAQYNALKFCYDEEHAELAALKARIAEAPVATCERGIADHLIANTHRWLPAGMEGTRVRLVMEE